jgi:methylamine dehydrogenase accessory protein MauD
LDGWWLASYIVLWVLVIVLCVVVVALARQIGTLHLRLGPRGALELDTEGPPLGEAKEPIDTEDLSGGAVTVGGPGRRALLLFVSPSCMVCEQILPSLHAVARSAGLAPCVLTELDRDEAALAFGPRPLGVPVVASSHAFAAYDVPGTPYAVVLDETGAVAAKGTPNNLEQLEGLTDSAAARMARASTEQRAS